MRTPSAGKKWNRTQTWRMPALVALLLGACGAPEATWDDSWFDEFARPAAGGKADVVAITLVPGNKIPSQFADPSKTYLSSRDTYSLEQLAALPEIMQGVAARVDGIIANKPADGRVSLDELVDSI